MKWLNFRPALPADPPQTRFLPTFEDPPAGVRRPEPMSAAQQGSGKAPNCTLISNDDQLAERCAVIALAAAVRLQRLRTPPERIIEQGPVLWGADLLEELDPGRRCDVLLGAAEQAVQVWQAASRLPQARVALLPEAAHWLGEYLGLWGMTAGHGNTIAVASRAGGLGASTLAVLLAHAGTLSGLRSIVIDADPHSTGLWPVLGMDPAPGIGWEELARSGGSLAAHQLRQTLPAVHDTAVLTWGSTAGTVVDEQLLARVLSATGQGYEFLVVDTGRDPHRHDSVLRHFIDRQVYLCDEKTLRSVGEQILTGAAVRAEHWQHHPSLLGGFSRTARIPKAAARGDLLASLTSRLLRQELADLQLLPGRSEHRRTA